MTRIDPTAVIPRDAFVDERARIGAGVVLGHGVVVEGDVEIGEGCIIGHHSVLKGPLTLGERNKIYPLCVLGEDGQHPDAVLVDNRRLVIGDDNVFREHVTVHQPTTTPRTTIGNRCYFMVQSHISHDAQIADDVKFAMGVTLAGYVTIGHGAYLGMHAVVHQRLVVGPYTMVGMNASVVKHVPVGAVLVGQNFTRLNRVGLRKWGHSDSDIDALQAGNAVGALSKHVADFNNATCTGNAYQPR